NRQIAEGRRRSREALEKPPPVEHTNAPIVTETYISRYQAAQRIRRNQELANKAEAEFQ
ncbi:hypothetical protein MKX01_028300, partial [Papaver californicum]